MKLRSALKSRRLYLRELLSADVGTDYVAGLNDPVVNKYLVGVRSRRQTVTGVRTYVEHNLRSPQDYLFGVFVRKPRRLIGTVRISEISWFHYCATIGVCIFDKENGWGMGYGREAVARVMRFAFNELGLHFLEGGVYEGNTSSAKLFRSLGFDPQVVYKAKYRYDRDFRPVTLFGMTNKRFRLPVC